MITLPPPQQQPIAIEYIIQDSSLKKPEYARTFDFLKGHVATATVPSIKNKICELSQLEENWDGYGACNLSETVIKNAYKFVDAARSLGHCPLSAEDVTPTPYGTIVIDYSSEAGLVSIEIGESKIGYFTDFLDGHNHSSKGIPTSFKIVPSRIKDNLSRL